jgi:hypothetical protein
VCVFAVAGEAPDTRLYSALNYQTPAAVEAEYYRGIETLDEQPLAGQLTAH